MSDEETRAAAWREQQQRRLDTQAAMELARRGDRDAAIALRQKFDALRPVNDDGVPRLGMEWLAP